jgi:hypothetical protein
MQVDGCCHFFSHAGCYKPLSLLPFKENADVAGPRKTVLVDATLSAAAPHAGVAIAEGK